MLGQFVFADVFVKIRLLHAAQGELQASATLAQAAHTLGAEPNALQLRYLQTVAEIAAENNSTTLFPIPIEMFRPFIRMAEQGTPPSGQPLPLPQVTVQSTPLFWESFVTVAVTFAVPPTTRLDGGCWVMVTEIGGAVVIVTTMVTDLVASAVEAALMVTVFPVGTAGGAA